MAKSSKAKAETTPATLLRRDIDKLRRDFKATVKAYSSQVEASLERSTARLRAAELTGAALKESRYPEMRDASSAIRRLNLKPEKGRRKDLKKIDMMAADLEDLLNDL